MDGDKRIMCYCAQRNIPAAVRPMWDVRYKLTARQQNRIARSRRRHWFGKRHSARVPF